jgi:hypothetical protein
VANNLHQNRPHEHSGAASYIVKERAGQIPVKSLEVADDLTPEKVDLSKIASELYALRNSSDGGKIVSGGHALIMPNGEIVVLRRGQTVAERVAALEKILGAPKSQPDALTVGFESKMGMNSCPSYAHNPGVVADAANPK